MMPALEVEAAADGGHRTGGAAGSARPGGDSSGALTASRCLRRIRRWRVPPHWSRREWFEEVEAEATVASLQARRDFDPARGVPWGAFLYQRILHAALARYRRACAYAIRRVAAVTLDQLAALGADDPPPREVVAKLLEKALRLLPDADSSLIEELYWGGKTEL